MLTVIVATHNGERTLPAVLDAYRDLYPPVGGWKLVVVDNGSTDRTPSILAQAEARLPLTRLTVAQLGKNTALNAALAHREGDLIVFSDDDAVPARDWLQALRSAADRNPEPAIFGGVIRPRWPRPPEPWLVQWVPQGIVYTITDQDLVDGPIPASCVWGPNMAIRASVFDTGSLFDERIGPKSGVAYAMGSETEFSTRMEQQGLRCWFVSRAVVEHIIRDFQMEPSWILNRAVRYGRGVFHRERLRGVAFPAFRFGFPAHRTRIMAGRLVRMLGARLVGQQERAFREAWGLRCDWGYIAEARSSRNRLS